ncbi:YciI family protein [Zunongwangia sp. H14]|uniref:YciI family protein n=1 Tax=Zunongwangia sp. H14 TaxID=3240792 RepID=UPI00356680E4
MMKRLLLALAFSVGFLSCEQPVEKTRGIPATGKVERKKKVTERIEVKLEDLKEEGYQAFTYNAGDTAYLMQQYYLVLLKSGQNRNQDSAVVAGLQQQHMAHLQRMAEEGYLSLAGPMGEEGEIRGIAIYNTPDQNTADSLAKADPMVKAGRLKIEVYPWWAAKGSKLN